VRAYQTGAELLKDADIPDDGCLVVDYKLPKMNGLDPLVGSPTRMLQLRNPAAGEGGHAPNRKATPE
jgi:FixJ family two-component response regulator